MEIKTVITGALEENCYILISGKDAIVIDPGDNFAKIKEAYQNYHVHAIMITHRHFDHIGALEPVQKDTNAKVLEYSNLEEKQYQIGPFSFEVIFTKGHSKDSATYYFKEQNCMFVGDFIFQNSIGRMDLEGGSEIDMKHSIEHIKTYPSNTFLYPGHGPSTTLEQEKRYNPFFK